MPLFGSLLPFRNKLAYPAGVKPGFDPSHPAFNSLGVSAVATAAGAFIDVLHSQVAALQISASTLQSGIRAIGPGAGFTAQGGNGQWLLSPYINDNLIFSTTKQTLAAILTVSSAGTNYQGIITNSNAGTVLVVNTSSQFDCFSSIDHNSSATLNIGDPYFFAASVFSGATNLVNMVVVNLKNGVTVSNAFSGVAVALTSDTLFTIGQNRGNTNQSFNGYVAAAMMTSTFLSMQQLLMWAADPWAFWYPRATPVDWVGKTAVAATFPFVRRNIIRASAKGFR